MFINVWCEYDINGSFGGDNNEDIFEVDDTLTPSEVEALVLSKLKSITGLGEEDLEDLYSWEFITIKKLD